MGRRSLRFGPRLLLLAMSLQAITPDFRDLASARIFHLVSAGLLTQWDHRPEKAPSDRSAPAGHDEGAPDDSCGLDQVVAAPRMRLGQEDRPRLLLFLNLPPRDAGIPSADVPPCPGAPAWSSERSLPSLCRFRC